MAHLSSELRARFDKLGGVGHEPGILSFVSSESHHDHNDLRIEFLFLVDVVG